MTITGAALDIQTPRAFLPFLTPARYKGAKGGRGSTKSWSFATNLVEKCIMEPGSRAACIREVQRSLEHSVKRLLMDRIRSLGQERKFVETTSHIKTPGDGVIIFEGMQGHTADSIKSLEGFNVAWVEEAQSLSDRSLTLLRPTLRAPNSELWFTWNPRYETDPIDKLLVGTPPPNAIVRHVNYTENPWLSDVLRGEMEFDRSRDYEKYEHVWLGGYEKFSNSRVLKNWTVQDFVTPPEAEFLFGGDFGFANDPTTLVRCFIVGRTLYIDAEAYAIGCEIDHTAALYDGVGCTQDHEHGTPASHCDGMARGWTIVADSARPETISYLQRHGYDRLVGASKGPGSLEEGIEFLRSFDIVVHPRCVHCIDELKTYRHKTHPLTGDILPKLEDKKNHVIDAIRYAVEKLRLHLKGLGLLAWGQEQVNQDLTRRRQREEGVVMVQDDKTPEELLEENPWLAALPQGAGGGQTVTIGGVTRRLRGV